VRLTNESGAQVIASIARVRAARVVFAERSRSLTAVARRHEFPSLVRFFDRQNQALA
jgi:hypothetical protein